MLHEAGKGKREFMPNFGNYPNGTLDDTNYAPTPFEVARKKAAESVEPENPALAARIRLFQFRDIRPKAASEMELSHARKLLGHTDQQITRSVYQRVGETVLPTK